MDISENRTTGNPISIDRSCSSRLQTSARDSIRQRSWRRQCRTAQLVTFRHMDQFLRFQMKLSQIQGDIMAAGSVLVGMSIFITEDIPDFDLEREVAAHDLMSVFLRPNPVFHSKQWVETCITRTMSDTKRCRQLRIRLTFRTKVPLYGDHWLM